MTEYKGYYYDIIQDEYAESPDDWGNTDIFLVYDHRQFWVERDGFDPEEIYDYLQAIVECFDFIKQKEYYESLKGFNSRVSYFEYKISEIMDEVDDFNDYYIFPVYAYIHSGVSLSLSSFSCPWDTSISGFVLVDKNSFKNITEDKAKEYAEGLIDDWNKYLSGEIYCYEIYKETKCDCCGHVEREFIECVGGYYDEEQCEEDAKDIIDNLNK